MASDKAFRITINGKHFKTFKQRKACYAMADALTEMPGIFEMGVNTDSYGNETVILYTKAPQEE